MGDTNKSRHPEVNKAVAHVEDAFGFAPDKALLMGLGHGVSCIIGAQAVEDITNFPFQCSLFDEYRASDCLVRAPDGDRLQYLHPARGQELHSMSFP